MRCAKYDHFELHLKPSILRLYYLIMIPINLPSLISLSGQRFIQPKITFHPRPRPKREKKTDVKLSVQVHKNSSTIQCESKNKTFSIFLYSMYRCTRGELHDHKSVVNKTRTQSAENILRKCLIFEAWTAVDRAYALMTGVVWINLEPRGWTTLQLHSIGKMGRTKKEL